MRPILGRIFFCFCLFSRINAYLIQHGKIKTPENLLPRSFYRYVISVYIDIGYVCTFRVTSYLITPNSLPTLMKAAIALSRCSFS